MLKLFKKLYQNGESLLLVVFSIMKCCCLIFSEASYLFYLFDQVTEGINFQIIFLCL